MEYQIKQCLGFTVSGFKHSLKTKEAFDIIPGFWTNASKDGSIQRLIALCSKTNMPTGILGVCVDGQYGESPNMDYYMAVTTSVDVPECTSIEIPEGMDNYKFPAATWAIFNADGKLPEAIQKVIRHFHSEWLPKSDYRLDNLPMIESYMQNNRQEVWVAIKEK